MKTFPKLSITILLFGFSLLLIPQSVLAFEHPRYSIDASVDITNKKLTATQEVTFTNNTQTPTDVLYFHIYPNRKYTPKEKNFILRYAGYFKADAFPEGIQDTHMIIEEIKKAETALAFVIEGEDRTILKVSLPETLTPGQSVTVTIKFTDDIPHYYGRFGWHDSIMTLARWYPILSVYNDAGWNNHPFYPYHRPFFSDAAFYKVRLTVPENQVVIHTGELTEETKKDSSTKELLMEASQPVRDFAFTLSHLYEVAESSFKGIQLKAYYLPGNLAKAQKSLEIVKSLMEYYTKFFGPYPYKTFSIAPVHLGYGGEQLSNMILIDTRAFEMPAILDRYLDFLVAHETGHQWFYNLVGFDDFTQMWLEEGINSYFLSEYLDEKYGPDASILQLPGWSDKFIPRLTFRRTRDVRYKLLTRTGQEHPIIDKLSSFGEPSSIFSLTYGKGSRVAAMLKNVIGEEAFKNVFKKIFEEYKYQNLDIKEFMVLCEKESKQDLGWFFHQWLYEIKNFDVEIAQVKGNTITLKNHREIKIPVDVRVEMQDGTIEDLMWDGRGQKTGTLTVRGTSPIKTVVADPEQKLLDIDQTNNSWPRKIRFHPVPLYHPLYDIPIFEPEDSYNVVFGPEINQGIGFKASVQKPYDQIAYAGTDWDINEDQHHSRLGYQLNNIWQSQTALQVEIRNTQDYDGHKDDLASGQLTLRRELWPAAYGVTQVNDHVSLYLIRNQSLKSTYTRNTSYLRRDEAIVGTGLHLSRARPYWDPREGFTFDTFVESSGHFLGATQYFNRGAVDWAAYQMVTERSKLAVRLKYGLGGPHDKNLFEIGGINGLRGFDRKTIRGANAALGSLEYRFPLVDNLNWKFFDNTVGLEGISGVTFFDAGQSWYAHMDDSRLYKDAGLGLRFHVNVGSMLERIVLRLDAAQAINESDDDTHYWFGVNHAF